MSSTEAFNSISSNSNQNSPGLILSDNSQSSKSKSSLFSSQKSSVQLLSGCLSGLITCLLFQPFDLIKTRQQQQQKVINQVTSIPSKPSKFSNSVVSHVRPSLPVIVKEILRQDGISGYWRGTIPTVFRNVPGMGLYFLTFEKLKLGITWIKASKPSPSEQLVCGAGARALVGFMLMPISVIKVRVESNIYPEDNNIRRAFRSIYYNQGVKGLFAGAGATALRDAPYAGLYIYFYQLGKSILIENPSSSPSLLANISSGIGAGFAATLLTHPFDVAKTRMQLDKVAYPNVLTTFKLLTGPELSRGLSMRLARKSLSSAISWAGYEQFVYWASSVFNTK